MKRIISVLLLLVICATLVSCGSEKDETVPEGMKKVDVDTNTYTLFVPENWVVEMSTGTVFAYVSSADSSNVTLAAYAPETQSDLDLTTFWSGYSEDFELTFGDSMHYVDTAGNEVKNNGDYKPEATTLDGYAAQKYVYTAEVTGDKYEFMQEVCVAEGYIYIFTYTALVDNFDANMEDVQSVLDNFKFN